MSDKTLGAEKPLVTICFATVGRVDYLDGALASIASQTYPNLEILVLDNASPSPARERVARFAEETAGARLLRVEERVPMFRNFNRGIEASRGEYVAFFHDDDIYDSTFLEHFVGLLQAFPEAGFAGGNYRVIDREGAIDRQTSWISETECWTGRRFIENLISSGRSPLPTPGLVFRREALVEHGFDESVSINWGDFPIFMAIAEKWDVAVSREVHYSWRVHGNNYSNLPWSQAIPQRTALLQEYLTEYAERFPEDSGFAGRLKETLPRMEVDWLVWGWFVAATDEDAEECRLLIRGTPGRTILRGFLRLLTGLGLTLSRRRGLALRYRRYTRARP